MVSSNASSPRRGTVTPCQRVVEPHKCRLFDRLDFAAQSRQAFAANLPQHFRIAPFAVMPVGPEFSFQQFALRIQRAQNRLNRGRLQLIARSDVAGRERSMRARVTANNFRQWVASLFEKYFRQARRQRRTKGIAITAGVFDGNESRFSGDAHAHGASRG